MSKITVEIFSLISFQDKAVVAGGSGGINLRIEFFRNNEGINIAIRFLSVDFFLTSWRCQGRVARVGAHLTTVAELGWRENCKARHGMALFS
jgi:hypothetical protein